MKLHADREEHRLSVSGLLRDDTTFASGKIAFFQYVTVGVFLFLIIHRFLDFFP